jgi:hypothetical protein
MAQLLTTLVSTSLVASLAAAHTPHSPLHSISLLPIYPSHSRTHSGSRKEEGGLKEVGQQEDHGDQVKTTSCSGLRRRNILSAWSYEEILRREGQGGRRGGSSFIVPLIHKPSNISPLGELI